MKRNKALNDSNKLYDELFKEKQRKLKEEEEKFLRDLNVRNENLMKIDSDRKQKNSKLVSQMKDLLQKQQKINNERKFAEKNLNERYEMNILQDVENFRNEEFYKKLKNKEKLLKYKEDIIKQMNLNAINVKS